MDSTAVFNIINVLAILLSPLIALQVQKYLNTRSEKIRRKEELFNTLMETRAQPLIYEHVRTLNKIDVVFHKDREVINSWSAYRDHLNSAPPPNASDAEKKIWQDKTFTNLTTLLYKISMLLGYDFDETLIKKGAYMPVAHGIFDLEHAVIRKGLVAIFENNKPLKIELVDPAHSEHND